MAGKKKPTKPTTKKTARDIKFKNYKKAIIISGGFVTKTAEALGISHPSVSEYISNHPKLQDLIESIQESYLDIAEDKLLSLIKEGNLTAMIFYLKCKGKTRGYIEKQEFSIPELRNASYEAKFDNGKYILTRTESPSKRVH